LKKNTRARRTAPGFTLVEMLVCIAIVAGLSVIAISIAKSSRQKAYLVSANEKLRSLGSALVGYTTDTNGLLPFEDSPGTDDWTTAADPANAAAWYNALPRQMGFKPVGELGNSPEMFYADSYPIFIQGAPYPDSEKKFGSPYFAVGMNSRLQRKGEDGIKVQGKLAMIRNPARTVAFLERGMPDDEKVNKAQSGFDAGPKANPRAFAARHNQKGVLVFFDGHAETRAVSDLIGKGGLIVFPQTDIVWTMDPEEDPN